MSEFPLLNVAFFLPHPFVMPAIETIASVTRFVMGSTLVRAGSRFGNVGVAAQLQ